MRTTYRNYPYPVLAFFNNDYPNNSFSYEIKSNSDNNKFKIEIDFNLNCKTLNDMLTNGLACFLVHIECPKTRFRNIYTTTESRKEIFIDGGNLNNKVEVVVSVISTSKNNTFTSDEFNSIFGDNEFSIVNGDILAIAPDCVLTIEKDETFTGSSLFNITYSDKLKVLTWEIENSSILIKLPKDTFDLYNSLKSNARARSIITNTVVVPILVEVLTSLKYESTLYDDDFIEKINLSLESIGYSIEKLADEDSIAPIVFKLIDNILFDSLTDLYNILEEEY
ncbi:MAG: hypothetical protein RSD77_09330 [Romboutsia sp.]